MSYAQHDPQHLIQYLLGSLPESEAERLDELAVTNDEFAWRLADVENDLVDSYVRGELSGETLARFQVHYLSSSKRRDKVKFAETLRDFTARPERIRESPIARRRFEAPRLAPSWALAAAAVLVIGLGYLLLANGSLREQLARARSEGVALENRAHDLQGQLDEIRAQARSAPTREELTDQSTIERLQIISLILPPPTRGPGGVPSISVPPGTDVVALQLQLESDEFSVYQAILRAADNRVIWRSGKLYPTRAGPNTAVTAGLPARVLASARYSIELSGVTASGSAEVLGAYVFRIVIG